MQIRIHNTADTGLTKIPVLDCRIHQLQVSTTSCVIEPDLKLASLVGSEPKTTGSIFLTFRVPIQFLKLPLLSEVVIFTVESIHNF